MPHPRTLAAVATALLLGGLLAACDPIPDGGPGTASPDTTESSTPTPSDSPTPAPGPDSDASPDPNPDPAPVFGADARADLRDAITSGNTAAIEGYLADPVTLIIMSSECCGELRPAAAVAELPYVTSAPGPWNFSLPAATIAGWRTNTYYGRLFTGDEVVGRAADGTIVSFGIVGDRVTTILMGFEEGFTY